jgi:GST-like protein
MIDLYYWPTPNGWKVSIALEELSLPYTVVPVNIGRGDQFKPDFLAISPNNRIPAIVDQKPADGGKPVSVFETGAILVYLAEKTGCLLPTDIRGRKEVLEWVMWQMGGLGPMLGQAHHFRRYAPRKIKYGIERYTNEANRLYGILDRKLKGREYIVGDYSIADVACWPWIVPHKRQGQDLDEFPNIRRWFDTMKERPAVQKGFQVGAEWIANLDEKARKKARKEARKVLFGQKAMAGK